MRLGRFHLSYVISLSYLCNREERTRWIYLVVIKQLSYSLAFFHWHWGSQQRQWRKPEEYEVRTSTITFKVTTRMGIYIPYFLWGRNFSSIFLFESEFTQMDIDKNDNTVKHLMYSHRGKQCIKDLIVIIEKLHKTFMIEKRPIFFTLYVNAHALESLWSRWRSCYFHWRSCSVSCSSWQILHPTFWLTMTPRCCPTHLKW